MRTQRNCKHCGKIYYGGVDSLYCPECAQMARKNNVVRDRICIDCGTTFPGGPRARRCPECRHVAMLEASRRSRQRGTIRPLGSVDVCPVCGQEYIVVSGRQKYCSDNCQRAAVLEWQRERKKEYNTDQRVVQARKSRRAERQKVCAYCLRPFWESSSTNLCSNYCRSQQKQIQWCESEARQGHNVDLQKYYNARDEYREKIKNTPLTDHD